MGTLGRGYAVMTGHTPTPWIVNPFCAQIDCAVLGTDGYPLPVAQMLWPTDERSEAETYANAARIVLAVNCFDELRALLTEADRVIAWESCGLTNTFSDRVEAALAKAGAGS